MLKRRFSSRFLLVVSLLVVVPGCFKKINKKQAALSEAMARQVDIPAPLQAHLIGYETASDNDTACLMRYSCSGTVQALHQFYRQEMERQGWQLCWKTDFSERHAHLYEKPRRYCLISYFLDKKDKKHEVVIMTGSKEEGYS